MKLSLSCLTLLAFTVLLSSAFPLGGPQQFRRDGLEKPIYSREPTISERSDIEDLESRGIFGIFKKIGGKIFGHHHKQNQQRDLSDEDELYMRGLAGDDEEFYERGLTGDEDELYERGLAGDEDEYALFSRDPDSSDELESRGLFGIFRKIGGKIFGHHNNNQRREEFEYEAREPQPESENDLQSRGIFSFIKKIFHRQ
ncbi:hypothetical protein BDQ12DRAFT_685263 [Crucibulum laeve]|uniref:Uncharacterized protein n=1 Tax=Crucibulum laeve TaxID=68775 RepID=A0A5C3LZ61_9AGAR|nr:hypothetical protein BDQ12DRAFT_685263 [Crucibulum laeve]